MPASTPQPTRMPCPGSRRRLLQSAAGLAAAAVVPVAWAQPAYPSRPVTLVVPYTAGGAADAGARMLAPELARQLGQPVVVDNVPGAGGALGMQRLARSAPDGYTLAYGGLSEALLVPQINPSAGYRPEELTPLAMAGSSPVAVVARPDFAAANLDEMVELVRRQPGRLSYGSAGIGSFAHVMAEVIKDKAGLFLVHIPYRGGTQILADLVGGQIDLAITTVSNATGMATARRIRMLGVTARERLAGFRDVPTFGESRSLRGLDMQVWAIVFAPPGLPDPLADRLNAAIQAALQSPAVREMTARIGGESAPPFGVAQTRAFLRAQQQVYLPVTRRIKPE